MVQVLRELTRKSSFLGLLLVNRKGLMGEVAVGGHPGHGKCKAVKYKIFDDRRKIATRTSAMNMERADFRLLRELVSKVPRETAFEGIQGQECWSFFKYYLLRAWEQAISKYQNSCRWSKRLA